MIFPNWSSKDLLIETIEQLDEIQISDTSVRIVYNKSNIYVSEFADVTYSLHIKTSTGKIAVQLFMKQ